jgi:hypothetical protein
VQNRLGETIKHMAYVNSWSTEQAEYTADKAFTDWEIRNQYQWQLDLALLDTRYDIKMRTDEQAIRQINAKYLADIQKNRQSASLLNHLFSGH